MSWIVETSEQKIGQVWTAEDHAALVRQIGEADRLYQRLMERMKFHPRIELTGPWINGVSE